VGCCSEGRRPLFLCDRKRTTLACLAQPNFRTPIPDRPDGHRSDGARDSDTVSHLRTDPQLAANLPVQRGAAELVYRWLIAQEWPPFLAKTLTLSSSASKLDVSCQTAPSLPGPFWLCWHSGGLTNARIVRLPARGFTRRQSNPPGWCNLNAHCRTAIRRSGRVDRNIVACARLTKRRKNAAFRTEVPAPVRGPVLAGAGLKPTERAEQVAS